MKKFYIGWYCGFVASAIMQICLYKIDSIVLQIVISVPLLFGFIILGLFLSDKFGENK